MQAKNLDLPIDALGDRQGDFLQGFDGDREFFADAGEKFEGHARFSWKEIAPDCPIRNILSTHTCQPLPDLRLGSIP